MGSFYVNFAVRTDRPTDVLELLRAHSRRAFVAPSIDGKTIFYDEDADSQSGEVINHLGALVSSALKCPVMATLNHDDDILMYWLFQNGELVDTYNSSPGYWTDGDRTPEGGNAEKLCRAFGIEDEDTIDEVDLVLSEDEDYVFALDRHKELAEWLHLPFEYICMNFRNCALGNVAEGVDPSQLVATF